MRPQTENDASLSIAQELSRFELTPACWAVMCISQNPLLSYMLSGSYQTPLPVNVHCTRSIALLCCTTCHYSQWQTPLPWSAVERKLKLPCLRWLWFLLLTPISNLTRSANPLRKTRSFHYLKTVWDIHFEAGLHVVSQYLKLLI